MASTSFFARNRERLPLFEALPDHFCVHCRHALPGPNVKAETQMALNVLYEAFSVIWRNFGRQSRQPLCSKHL
jgi:hypothetical protein